MREHFACCQVSGLSHPYVLTSLSVYAGHYMSCIVIYLLRPIICLRQLFQATIISMNNLYSSIHSVVITIQKWKMDIPVYRLSCIPEKARLPRYL